ncbi:hypothetical protein BGZ99_004856 [Dissophora globulifera]|uniref:Uncharacterized protein n=1 Tax=Dissophora globulifera TaxID=979702 RepID=A0A9P6UUL1_9FUNG|nr:hypothetical protein BGZ99_004856 [Dissophora globulifera]
MAHIRAPMASTVRLNRHCRTTPRCIVVTLTASFIVFNYVVFYIFQSVSPDLAIDHTSSPLSPQGYVWSGPSINDKSYQTSPTWYSEWIRWRGLDPGYVNLVPSPSSKIDFVYTWVNGSDPQLSQLRLEQQAQSSVFADAPQGDEAATAKRFRDMDELRYSIRSLADYARDLYRHVFLLTTEVQPGQGQLPSWLDLSQDIIRPINHRAIFENSSYLPTFNSLAIESQLHHLPGLSDIFVYMNDDVFLGTPMLSSDFWTPLYGFVFHLEGSLLVPPTIRAIEKNPRNVGEWSSLQYSNYLLSQRFGPRYRSYIAHVSHVLSVPILREMQALWPDDFDATGSHRFRGEGDAKDIQVSFFMAHYIIEKLRETQLESFWFYRLDENQDNILQWRERDALIYLIQSWNLNQNRPEQEKHYHSRPTMIDGYDRVLKRAGIPMSGSTTYRLAGLDGYPFLMDGADTSKPLPLKPYFDINNKETQPQVPYMRYEPPQKRKCQLDLEFCFGSDFINPAVDSISMAQSKDIFHRLAFQEIHCGDCLLEILMQHPGSGGMGAWMPSDERSTEFTNVVERVQRYNYVLGTSDYSFLALQAVDSAQKNLDGLLQARRTKAFFCINDDFADDPDLRSKMQGIFKNFLDTRFSIASPWER